LLKASPGAADGKTGPASVTLDDWDGDSTDNHRRLVATDVELPVPEHKGGSV